MERFFNTAGPVDCLRHYCLPPLSRIDYDEIIYLIKQQKYFILHAPRQTGKTTYLLALMERLNREGEYACLYANVEMAQSAREDVRRGIATVVTQISSRAEDEFHGNRFREMKEAILATTVEDAALYEYLSQMCRGSDKPIVLLIDEIDSLVGDTLISVLRQLRTGYDKRPAGFPQSVILCGVRDVRDYRIHSSKAKEIITGGSAFNIKAESLRLGNFTEEEIARLYGQHTEETGQAFQEGVVALVLELTDGQPWLVNALAYEACYRMKENRDRSRVITPETMQDAKEALILRRETHLDQLIDKLREERVRRVLEPILEGVSVEQIPTDDIEYVIDLGLIRREGQLKIANKIYEEIIPRELTWGTQVAMVQEPVWYQRQDGSLDMKKLLRAFQEFFRENSEIWIERFDYKEAGPQLLMQAFLQRIMNSGGRVEREYGLGKGRTDLLVIRKYEGKIQKEVIELKILRKTVGKTLQEGLAQTKAYADRCGCREAHLVIFDRRPGVSWDTKIYERTEEYEGMIITVWGM